MLLALLLVLFPLAEPPEAFSPEVSTEAPAPHDTLKVPLYLRMADAKVEAGEPDSAEHYFGLAITLATRLNVYALEMRALEELLRFLHRQLKYDEALLICEQLRRRAEEADDLARLANVFNNMGVINQALGRLPTAAEHYIHALDLAEKTGHSRNQTKFNSNLASVFIDLNDKKKSLYYARKGYALALNMGDSLQISASLVNLSCSEIINELYDDAIVHLNDIINISTKLGHADRVLDGYINLADIFVTKKRYPEALEILLKAEKGVRQSTPPDYLLYIYHGLARVYFLLNDYDRALSYYNKLYPDVESSFPLNELKDIYLFGAELNEKRGAFESALAYQKKHNVLKDSLIDATAKSRIHELELKYQHTLKNKALAEQQLLIANQESALERKNKVIVVIVAVIVVISALAVLAIVVYTSRQRALKNRQAYELLKARLLGEEEERARQARELHDGVSGLLTAARMHLSSIHASPAHTSRVMSLLNQAHTEVRNISHNLAPEIVLQYGLLHAVEDFIARIRHDDLEVGYTVVGEVPRLSTAFELLVYRAIQESINNVIRHAKATYVHVQLSCLEGFMTITVEDDGIGFELSEGPARGLGISNLASRVEAMHGTFDIASSPGQGTTVYIEVDITPRLTEQAIAPPPEEFVQPH